MAPLYHYLTKATGGDIKWNFTKILVGRNGEIITRFEPATKPESPEVAAAVEKALAE
jgi:glutathione peroxidase